MIRRILCDLVQVYVWVIIIRIVLSYFPAAPGGALARVNAGLGRVTEPVLGPVRRVLPPIGVGGMGLDLSPLIVLLVLQLVVIRLICAP